MSETGTQSQPDDALVDLLVKQATEGLSPAEQRVLDASDSAAATQTLRDFELAAAAITLAGSSSGEPLPAALRARIEHAAQDHFAFPGVLSAASAGGSPAPARRGGTLPWFAAAACLLLALIAWLRPPPAQPTLQQERAALMARPDTLKVPLAATKDPAAAGVTGDAVWDPVTQKGFLHFVGLAANDPKVRQYQLWIFDGDRDQRYPVDGGVFDVPANSAEVVIPIHAGLPVRSAKAFAVTVEQPGGVVVSAREHVLVLGAAG